MKKYTEAIKETKEYFYLYCFNCNEIYIDDLYYLKVLKICPKCKQAPLIITGEKPLNEKQIKDIADNFIKKQKLDKIRKNNLIIN